MMDDVSMKALFVHGLITVKIVINEINVCVCRR